MPTLVSMDRKLAIRTYVRRLKKWIHIQWGAFVDCPILPTGFLSTLMITGFMPFFSTTNKHHEYESISCPLRCQFISKSWMSLVLLFGMIQVDWGGGWICRSIQSLSFFLAFDPLSILVWHKQRFLSGVGDCILVPGTGSCGPGGWWGCA